MTCKTCKATCKTPPALNPRQYWHVQDVQDVRHPRACARNANTQRIPPAHTSITCARPLARLPRLAHTIKKQRLTKKKPCTYPCTPLHIAPFSAWSL